MGALHRVRFARSELPIDLGERLICVLAEVLFDRIDNDHPCDVLRREEDFERFALPDQKIEGCVADFLVALDLSFEAGQGVGILEVFAVDRDPGEAPGL